MEDFVKIFFRFYSNILDEETVETLWAQTVDDKKGYYKIDNIPFYAPLIASDDIIRAEYDKDEGMLTYRETIKYSGNSTIHVFLIDKEHEINSIRESLERIGCVSEKLNNRYFALEVPSQINYTYIKKKLDILKNEDIIDYAETSLSEQHQY